MKSLPIFPFFPDPFSYYCSKKIEFGAQNYFSLAKKDQENEAIIGTDSELPVYFNTSPPQSQQAIPIHQTPSLVLNRYTTL